MKEKNKKLIVLLLITVITVSSAVAMVVIFRAEDKPQPVSVSSLSVKSYLTKNTISRTNKCFSTAACLP